MGMRTVTAAVVWVLPRLGTDQAAKLALLEMARHAHDNHDEPWYGLGPGPIAQVLGYRGTEHAREVQVSRVMRRLVEAKAIERTYESTNGSSSVPLEAGPMAAPPRAVKPEPEVRVPCGITRCTGRIEWVCVAPVHDTEKQRSSRLDAEAIPPEPSGICSSAAGRTERRHRDRVRPAHARSRRRPRHLARGGRAPDPLTSSRGDDPATARGLRGPDRAPPRRRPTWRATRPRTARGNAAPTSPRSGSSRTGDTTQRPARVDGRWSGASRSRDGWPSGVASPSASLPPGSVPRGVGVRRWITVVHSLWKLWITEGTTQHIC